jgi:hypothetical protein
MTYDLRLEGPPIGCSGHLWEPLTLERARTEGPATLGTFGPPFVAPAGKDECRSETGVIRPLTSIQRP